MPTIERDRARAAFQAYVDPYDMGNPRIALKVAHTYRVAGICERIARAEGWPEPDADLAWLCGLLHDIGRFEQVRLWDTFRDGDSASHAAIGVAVLRGEDPAAVPAAVPARIQGPAPMHPAAPGPGSGHLRYFVPDGSSDDLVVSTVAQHSALRVDGSLPARTRAFCDVVRDADKIDILRVNCENSPRAVLGVSDGEFLASGISDAALRGFRACRCLSRDERLEPADHLVGMLCFMFELVYPESVRIVREQGCLERLLREPLGMSEPFVRASTRAAWDEMACGLRAWMDGRSG